MKEEEEKDEEKDSLAYACGEEKGTADHDKESHDVVAPRVRLLMIHLPPNQDWQHLATLSQRLCRERDIFESCQKKRKKKKKGTTRIINSCPPANVPKTAI